MLNRCLRFIRIKTLLQQHYNSNYKYSNFYNYRYLFGILPKEQQKNEQKPKEQHLKSNN